MPSSCATHVSLLLLALLHLLPLPATSISFNYPSFGRANFSEDPSGCSEGTSTLCLKGDATLSTSDGSIQFTNHSGSEGWAVYSEALLLWDSEWDNTTGLAVRRLTNFTTTFSINLTESSGNCTTILADGLAFFLSVYPHRSFSDSGNGLLGLVSPSDRQNATGDSRFVAVEIDTYSNNLWDPSFVHVGIDVNSIRSVEVRNLSRLAAQSQTKLDIIGEVRVDYSSVTRNLTVKVERDKVVYAELSHHVDLSTVLPQFAAVGLSAASGYCPEYHRVMSWSFDSTWDRSVDRKDTSSKIKTTLLVVVIVVGLLLLLGVLCFLAWKRKQRKKREHEQELEEISMISEVFTGGPRKLNYANLVSATGNFEEKRKLGAGGSGAVYRGFLRELNREVAIKRVSNGEDTQRGRKEYMAEVKVISQLRHRHLVQLLGWCHQGGDFLLVYELMPNRSLDQHLFAAGGADLRWPVRYNIALGVASALLYLHEEADRCVVHRDVKSSNVMLDEAFQAKLGDFGLARLTEHGHGLETTMMGGTIGYMAPECFYTGRASKESDVYAFGVVALEIASGRRAVAESEQVRLVQWVWDLFAREAVLEAADGRLGSDFDGPQMERLLLVGLWCAHPDAAGRPTIRKAMAALNMEDVKIDLPRQMPVPFYFVPPNINSPTPLRGPDSAASTASVGYSVPTIYYDGR